MEGEAEVLYGTAARRIVLSQHATHPHTATSVPLARGALQRRPSSVHISQYHATSSHPISVPDIVYCARREIVWTPPRPALAA
eukprot:2091512-Rhodomonas_salina.1